MKNVSKLLAALTALTTLFTAGVIVIPASAGDIKCGPLLSQQVSQNGGGQMLGSVITRNTLLLSSSSGVKIRSPFLTADMVRRFDTLENRSAILLQIGQAGSAVWYGFKIPTADVAFLKEGYSNATFDHTNAYRDRQTLAVKGSTLTMATRRDLRPTNGVIYLNVVQIEASSVNPKKNIKWVRSLTYFKINDEPFSLGPMNEYGSVPSDVAMPTDDFIDQAGL